MGSSSLPRLEAGCVDVWEVPSGPREETPHSPRAISFLPRFPDSLIKDPVLETMLTAGESEEHTNRSRKCFQTQKPW